MKTDFLIVKIMHSGRKDERFLDRIDGEYRRLFGLKVGMDVDQIKRGQCFTFWLCNHPYYSFWTTSMILEAFLDRKEGVLYLETENTIYGFRPLQDIDSKNYNFKYSVESEGEQMTQKEANG